MPLPRSPEGAVEINRGCNPRRTRSLTRLAPAPRRGAGHRSRLASSPSAFSRAPAGRAPSASCDCAQDRLYEKGDRLFRQLLKHPLTPLFVAGETGAVRLGIWR